MKQLVQHLSDGTTTLEDVPAPGLRDGHVLIRSCCSLVSPGTERMLLSFGKAGWINKARQQPDRVRQVFDKMRTDGIRPTLQAVRNKINQPIPLGYSNVGKVMAVGKGVRGLAVGDRVVSNGHHAAVVCVPQHLTALIPESVSDEAASFTVLGAIALHSIRLARPTFGETIVVIGLGLIGQLTVQLLAANGCRVIGIDTDEQRCSLAARQGIITICSAHDIAVAEKITALTGMGADAVLITASAPGNDIIAQAAQMSRKRGRIILTGVVGLHIRRADFYEKELSFQVSCSYGPGRYDYQYEQQGVDYPAAYVRWTEQRNFEAILQAMVAGQVRTEHLLTLQVPITEYARVYDQLSNPAVMASLLTYDQQLTYSNHIHTTATVIPPGKGHIGLIGAGAFTAGVLLPALQQHKAVVSAICSEHGLSAALLAKRFSLPVAGTDAAQLLADPETDTIVIATRHNTHAALCIAALQAGKHVFVEKPLALQAGELDQIQTAHTAAKGLLHVGFNRRFAPLSERIRTLLSTNNTPLNIVITVNAGQLPANHWLSDPLVSGGRIVGEACHFIDLCSFFCDSPVTAVCANAMDHDTDQLSILLRYANGSNATINYFTNGHKAYDKERIELFHQGRVLVLENWKKLSGYGFRNFSTLKTTQDKGHSEQVRLFLERIRLGGDPLIPFASLLNTSRATLAIQDSLLRNEWITVPVS